MRDRKNRYRDSDALVYVLALLAAIPAGIFGYGKAVSSSNATGFGSFVIGMMGAEVFAGVAVVVVVILYYFIVNAFRR